MPGERAKENLPKLEVVNCKLAAVELLLWAMYYVGEAHAILQSTIVAVDQLEGVDDEMVARLDAAISHMDDHALDITGMLRYVMKAE